MRFRSILYSIRQGLKNIHRNRMFSLASVGTIAACIFLIGLFYAIVANFQYIVNEVQSQVAITVFFDEEITDEEIESIGDVIKGREEVDYITFTSADEAWESFKNDYFADYPELADGYKDDNPLANSASYEIYLKDIANQKEFAKYLESIEGIRQVKYSESTASTLTDFGKLVGYVSIAIILVLLCVGVFLISNTVMIGIAVRKEEIKIMKLIGATNTFVRAPFVIEGVIIGIIGAAIPLIIIYFIYEEVVGYVMSQFQALSSLVAFLPIRTLYIVLIPLGLGIGAGIGLLGSSISIRKHLKV
ncbi:MAG: permease-like cell division protein FtsX [Eubacterium sp.]